MSARERKITQADLLSAADYQARRKDLRAQSIATKKNRRVEVGPFATFYSRTTRRCGCRSMRCCASRRAAPNRSRANSEAYNPLIPQGSELIATLMLEIETLRAATVPCARSAIS